ncbi:MAG: hypothetical protein ACK5OB_05695 [Pirellula sp.]
MSNFGLFQWIREGVKQSVLLGVSDAVEAIGTPETAPEYHPALQAFAKTPLHRLGASATADSPAPRLAGESRGGRKRLGKSLKEISPPKTSSAKTASTSMPPAQPEA